MKEKKKAIAVIYILLSALFFSLMNMFVRLSGDLPSVQKSFFRNLVSLAFAAAILKREGAWFSGKQIGRASCRARVSAVV